MKNKTLALNLILLIAMFALFSVSATLAYYFNIQESSADNHPNFDINTQDTLNNTHSITQEKDLIHYTKDTVYNAHLSTSNKDTARKTLKFENDITLTNNLVITADVGLYLNNYKLHLNGYNITINHTYYGSFVLEKGTVELSTGKFYIYLPNAEFIYNQVVFEIDGQPLSEESNQYPQNQDASPLYIAYSALFQTAKALASETHILHDIKSVDELGELQPDDSGDYAGAYNIASTMFSKMSYITISDFDLPFNYKGYDQYEIRYKSNNPLVLDNFGAVVWTASGKKDITLTAEVYYHDELLAYSVFNVSVVSAQATSSELTAIGKILLENYLDKYLAYDDDDEPYYTIDQDVILPKGLVEYGINYSFSVYGTSFEEDENGIDYLIDDVISDYNGRYLFSTNLEVTKIVVQISAEGSSITVPYNATCDSLTTTENYHTIAQDLISAWYSSGIFFTENTDMEEAELLYNRVELFYDIPLAFTSKGIKYVEYSLINDVNSLYEFITIDGVSYLSVVTQKDPLDYLDKVVLNVKVVFETSPEIVAIDIPLSINVKLTVDPGDNIHEFLPFYLYYNNMFESITGGYTLNSFNMPLYYGNGRRLIAYDISLNADNYMKSYISYTDTSGTLVKLPVKRTTGQSIADAFDDMIGAGESQITLAEILQYNAMWLFEFDLTTIPKTNTLVSIEYYYKGILGQGFDWIYYKSPEEDEEGNPISPEPYQNTYISKLTIPGILRNGSDGISDAVLYQWVFDKFKPKLSGDETYNGPNVVLNDWLSQDLGADGFSSLPTNIQSYLGIQYLRNVTRIKINNTVLAKDTFVNEIINYITEMPSLIHLDIRGAGVSDRAGGLVGGAENALMDKLSSTKIEILNLIDNEIYSFYHLEKMSSLKALYTHGNIAYGINSIFYGASGLTNVVSYTKLLERGVAVYNYSINYTNETDGKYEKGNHTAFELDASASDYVDLLSIEYQRRLKGDRYDKDGVRIPGVSITSVYNTLSSDYADYALSTSYDYFASSSSQQTTPINVLTGVPYTPTVAWSYYQDQALGIDEYNTTRFTLTYTFYLGTVISNTKVEIAVNFEVLRI